MTTPQSGSIGTLTGWSNNAATSLQLISKCYFAYQFVNLTAYFQMDDGGDLHEQILHIEANIEELTDVI